MMQGFRWMLVLVCVSVLLSLGGCQSPHPVGNAGPPLPHAGLVSAWLTGSFSSGEQAAADSENYFDIRLRVVPIWAERDGSMWLYVEQAAASALDRPYRQRVYEVFDSQEERGVVVSRVYTLPDAPAWAGAWAEPARFDALGPGDLVLREGCAVYLSWDVEAVSFVGGTRGSGCASSLGGAAYATSEVVLGPQGMTSWDRGFDADGNQVWGATEGAYEFVRVD